MRYITFKCEAVVARLGKLCFCWHVLFLSQKLLVAPVLRLVFIRPCRCISGSGVSKVLVSASCTQCPKVSAYYLYLKSSDVWPTMHQHFALRLCTLFNYNISHSRTPSYSRDVLHCAISSLTRYPLPSFSISALLFSVRRTVKHESAFPSSAIQFLNSPPDTSIPLHLFLIRRDVLSVCKSPVASIDYHSCFVNLGPGY